MHCYSRLYLGLVDEKTRTIPSFTSVGKPALHVFARSFEMTSDFFFVAKSRRAYQGFVTFNSNERKDIKMVSEIAHMRMINIATVLWA